MMFWRLSCVFPVFLLMIAGKASPIQRSKGFPSPQRKLLARLLDWGDAASF